MLCSCWHRLGAAAVLVLFVAVRAHAAEPVTADDAVALALKTAPSLEVLRADLERDQALARAVPLQDFKLQFEHRAVEQIFGPRLDTFGNPYTPLDRTFAGISWQPPRLWEMGLDQWIESSRAQASAADLEGARRQLATRVRLLHARILLLRQESALVAGAVELSERMRASIAQKLDAQASTTLQVSFADLEVLDVQLDADEVASELARAQATLARELGMTTVDVTGEVPGCVAAPPRDQVFAIARSHSPKLAALALRKSALDVDAIKTSLRYLPWLDDVSVGYSNQPTGKRDEIRAGIGLRIPVFAFLDGNGNDIDLKRTRLAAEIRDAEDELSSDVAAAVDRLNAAASLVIRHREATDIVTARSTAAIDEALATGNTDIITAAEVHARALKSKRSHIRATDRCVSATLELERLTGEVVDHAPTPPPT